MSLKDCALKQTTLQEVLAPLIGLPLRSIGRAADMLWVHFGEWREVPSIRGGTHTVGEWALHVQCPWRITRPPAILVGRGDCYYEAASDEPFNWETSDESRFDREAMPLNDEFENSPPLVEAVDVDAVGGFCLRLTRGYRFEIFPDVTSDSVSEHWRLFRPGSEESHFVFPKDLTPGALPMEEAHLNQIVDAWIAAENAEHDSPEYESNWWAISQVLDWGVEGEGELLWRFITAAYQRDLAEKAVGVLAAGPLEDLLAKRGPDFIDRVEEIARRDPKFNDLLGGVWRSTMTDEVWRRVQAARNNVW